MKKALLRTGPPSSLLRSRLRLRQLLLMDALGDEPSLHKAAQRLGMTQPNASRLLHELEDVLSVALFERSKSGLVPTDHGRVMIGHARLLLADLERAREEIAAVSDGMVGLVRVGTLTSMAPSLLAEAIARARDSHPGLRIRVVEGLHDRLVDELLKGELDLMLGRDRYEPRFGDLASEVLGSDELSLVCGPRHPLAGRRKLDEATLARETWILPPAVMQMRQRLDMQLMAACGERPLQVVESVSILTTLELIRRARMLGIMPRGTAAGFDKAGLLRVLPFDLGGMVGPVMMLRRATSSLSPAVQSFVDIVRAAAKDDL